MKFFSVLFNKESRNLLKVKRLFIKPNSRIRVIIEAVHFMIILYSAFALPVIVGFELTLSGFSLVMEYLVLAEAMFYSAAQFRIGQYEAGILTVDFKTILKSYIKRGMYQEVIAFIPFNLIFCKKIFLPTYFFRLGRGSFSRTFNYDSQAESPCPSHENFWNRGNFQCVQP